MTPEMKPRDEKLDDRGREDRRLVSKGPEVRYGSGGEGAHWYVPGNPPRCAYEIKGANGRWRSTTLRDARKHGWVPGVTTITRIPAAPGLERWKVRQGIMAALTHPKVHEITDHDELLRVLEHDSKEEARQAASKGTDIHKAVEKYFATGEVIGHEEAIQGVSEQIKLLVGSFDRKDWVPEETVTHPLGFGTRLDLYSVRHKTLLDFKGKEFGPDDRLIGYPDQCQQLAAGRQTVCRTARCANVFISRNNPGLVRYYEWTETELEKAWEEFKLLLQFWQVRNDMIPQMEKL